MIIYKYLDEKGAIKTIEENSVLLKTPLEYNDPFDSVFYVDKVEMEKAYDLYVNYQLFMKFYKDSIIGNKKANAWGKEIIKRIKQDIPQIKKTSIYKPLDYLKLGYGIGLKILGKNDIEQRAGFRQIMLKVMSGLRSLALISCFGATFDSMLMWSHYADKHKGACIEFEIDDKDFRQVSYMKKLPVFTLSKALEIYFGHDFVKKEIDTNKKEYQFVLQPIFTKSDIWEYEGEVRCVYGKTNLDSKIYERIDDDGKKMLLRMPPIKKIYLGCNASKEFVDEIRMLAKDIPIIKMKTCLDEYGLKTVEK